MNSISNTCKTRWWLLLHHQFSSLSSIAPSDFSDTLTPRSSIVMNLVTQRNSSKTNSSKRLFLETLFRVTLPRDSSQSESSSSQSESSSSSGLVESYHSLTAICPM